MWVIYSISPTTFNVLSELTGRVTEAAVLAVLAYTYPLLVHAAAVHGAYVPLDSIVTPPQSMVDALIMQLRRGGCLRLDATIPYHDDQNSHFATTSYYILIFRIQCS